MIFDELMNLHLNMCLYLGHWVTPMFCHFIYSFTVTMLSHVFCHIMFILLALILFCGKGWHRGWHFYFSIQRHEFVYCFTHKTIIKCKTGMDNILGRFIWCVIYLCLFSQTDMCLLNWIMIVYVQPRPT